MTHANDFAATSEAVKVLQTTCGRCGHVRCFVRSESLTVDQLEAVSSMAWVQCGSRGSVIGFLSYPLRDHTAQERLPLTRPDGHSKS